MLSDLLQDPKGLDFTLAFVDRVIRPEDPRAAAVALRRLAQAPPRFLPAPLRRGKVLGGSTSPVVPHLVVPTDRRATPSRVHDLIPSTSGRLLSPAVVEQTASCRTRN